MACGLDRPLLKETFAEKDEKETSSMAVQGNDTRNSVKKSPLVLVRELARLNNMTLEFDIEKEEGPQHAKTYSIMLTLGSQTWQGSGKSVKQAQMDAAVKALKEGNFVKQTKVNKKKIANPSSLTPTVMLNGLAMARGEPVNYKVVSRIPLPCQPIYRNLPPKTDFAHYDFNYGMFGAPDSQSFNTSYNNNYVSNVYKKPIQRWIYPHLFRVEVSVGERSFIGEGKTQQAARHDAAKQAFDALSSLPIPMKSKMSREKYTKNTKEERGLVDGNSESRKSEEKTNASRHKSSISMLYEKASAHKLQVDFHVVSEEGPPHLKKFTIRVTVENKTSQSTQNGFEVNVVAEGKGPNKKLAKSEASAAALEKLCTISLPPRNSSIVHKFHALKPGEEKSKPLSNPVLHPVSRLAQIIQAKHEKEPVYTVVSESKTGPRAMKFVMKCEALGQSAEGEGSNKREAKRVASEIMLSKLGFSPAKEKMEVSTEQNRMSKRKMKKDQGTSKSIQCNNEPRNKFKSPIKLRTLPVLVE